MEIIKQVATNEEIFLLEKKPNLVLIELKKVEVGDGLIVKNEEWTKSYRIYTGIHKNFREKGKFSVKRLKDKSGWLIIRLK